MDINRARLYSILESMTLSEHQRYNIGTYKEKKLHYIMKKYFEPDENYHEVPVNGFIADILRDNRITEIESAGFSGLGPKLAAYSPDYDVTMVHPLCAVKYVSWIDPESGTISPRKKSPKKEGPYDLLFELIRIMPYICNKNIRFVSPLLEVDEYKLLDGWSKDRKRGAHRFERIPLDIIDMVCLETDDDYIKYIPEACVEKFKVKDFAKAARIDAHKAQAVLKVMEKRGVIARDGNAGRAFLYSRTK